MRAQPGPFSPKPSALFPKSILKARHTNKHSVDTCACMLCLFKFHYIHSLHFSCRMVDALMQFTNDMSTDSESVASDNDASGVFWDVNKDTAAVETPMMLADSHVDVTTEEEDNLVKNNLGTLPSMGKILGLSYGYT